MHYSLLQNLKTTFFGVAILTSVCLLSHSIDGFSQVGPSRLLSYDTMAYPGSVWLPEGKRLDGRIIFNDNDGIVLLHLPMQKETKAFNAHTLSKFSLNVAGQERIFFSLEHTDPKTRMTSTEFFEVLKDLSDFLVLLKIDKVKTDRNRNPLKYSDTRSGSQTRTIYFIGADQQLEPYAKFVQSETIDDLDFDLFDNNREKKRFINADLLKKYTGKHFPALVDYAKQNDKGFKRIEHLIEILSHYEYLTGLENN